MLLKILDKHDLTGIFHLTCEGMVSWYDFAK
jgi:dTDP-4-dehydrorhamnose reductase